MSREEKIMGDDELNEVSGGAMGYGLDDDPWSATVPDGGDPGEYVIRFIVDGDENHGT